MSQPCYYEWSHVSGHGIIVSEMPFSEYAEEAQSCELEQFVGRHSYLFLYGLIAVEAPTEAGAEDGEEESELYADDGGETKIVGPTDATSRKIQVPVALALQKRTDSFPQMITIGRTSNNDVVIAHPSVSKFHAYVRVPAEGLPSDAPFQLCDADSGNGTLVNNNRVPRSPPTEINPGDTIRFGQVELTLLRAAQVWQRLHRRR